MVFSGPVVFSVKVECFYFALSIKYLIFLTKFANVFPLSYTAIRNWMLRTYSHPLSNVISSKTKSVAMNGTVAIQQDIPWF